MTSQKERPEGHQAGSPQAVRTMDKDWNESEWKSPDGKNKTHEKEELAGPRSHVAAGFYCGWLGNLKMEWNVFTSPRLPAEKWRKGAGVGMPGDPSM